jgi:hypothetical protein
MATVLDSLKSISGYPVPLRTFANIATTRNLALDAEAAPELLSSAEYRLAKADTMQWVSFAPNVRQSDIQFDLLFSDRQELRRAANAIYKEYGDNAYEPESKATFGYKGNRR